MSNVVQINANVLWKAAYDHDSNMWIGICPQMNLNALGETREELQKCINEAMQILLEDLFITQELEDFLRQNKWTYRGGPLTGRKPPKFNVTHEIMHISINAITALT